MDGTFTFLLTKEKGDEREKEMEKGSLGSQQQNKKKQQKRNEHKTVEE